MKWLADLAEAFVLGVLTPTSALCVLPMYPGFLAYLANQLPDETSRRRSAIAVGLYVTSGVVLFMFLVGLLFTTILQVSLTAVIGVVSPVAFGLLTILSILLLLDIDVGRFLPRAKTPTARSPWLSAFLYGFFFGAIVIPCNPLFIAVFFTRSVSVLGFGANLARFLAFGLGISAPLLAIAALSVTASGAFLHWLAKHKSIINRIAGAIMLGIALYYLIYVFDLVGTMISWGSA